MRDYVCRLSGGITVNVSVLTNLTVSCQQWSTANTLLDRSFVECSIVLTWGLWPFICITFNSHENQTLAFDSFIYFKNDCNIPSCCHNRVKRRHQTHLITRLVRPIVTSIEVRLCQSTAVWHDGTLPIGSSVYTAYMHCTVMYLASSSFTDHRKAISRRWQRMICVLTVLSQSLVINEHGLLSCGWLSVSSGWLYVPWLCGYSSKTIPPRLSDERGWLMTL